MEQTTAGPGTPPPPAPSGPRPIRRLPDEGPIAGVCAGIADYFAIDPAIVRIAAVVLALSGPGLIAYFLAWIFIPAASDGEPRASTGQPRERFGTQAVGIVLLAIAVSVIWGDWWSPARRWLFPFVLIGVGLWLVLHPADKRRTEEAPQGSPTSPGAPRPAAWSPGPIPAAAPVDSPASPTVEEPVAEAPTTEPTSATTVEAPSSTEAWAAAAARYGPTEAQLAARRRRRLVNSVVWGALLVWAGAAVLFGVALHAALAVALGIVGVGFVVGAVVGGARALVGPAIALSLALLALVLIDVPLEGPIGDRTWIPLSAEELDGEHKVALGEGTLDLTHLDLDAGDVVEAEATVAIGHLVVRVPEGAALDIDARASFGEVVILGRSDNGYDVDVDRVVEGDTARSPRIVLDLRVGTGQLEVVEGP